VVISCSEGFRIRTIARDGQSSLWLAAVRAWENSPPIVNLVKQPKRTSGGTERKHEGNKNGIEACVENIPPTGVWRDKASNQPTAQEKQCEKAENERAESHDDILAIGAPP
jgi:hypothetical protein